MARSHCSLQQSDLLLLLLELSVELSPPAVSIISGRRHVSLIALAVLSNPIYRLVMQDGQRLAVLNAVDALP